MGETEPYRHSARYRQSEGQDPADKRLRSPVFAYNSPPLIAALAPYLTERTGTVLEIGAGTGQHAAAFQLAFPGLDWRASDPDPIHRASIAAWAAEYGLPDHAPLDIDASGDWGAGFDDLTAVISLNVIHIAPMRVAEGIIAGAGKALASGGFLMFYGPFTEDGTHISPSNAAFDAGLRTDNPDWGVRDLGDITDLAKTAGLAADRVVPLPSNNRLAVFRKG
ncbi:MAG: DUF938 domain-containing protein [Rhodobacteraceae bacterium]|nr:DUF938 domain-containing protein [Alphaproteobacteria bacterium]NNK68358.1 DUF938 domain-containing protein [Paracoccaceae bacterium]